MTLASGLQYVQHVTASMAMAVGYDNKMFTILAPGGQGFRSSLRIFSSLQQQNIHALEGWFSSLDGTVRFKDCKQLFEYQHLLLLRDIWWSKLYSIFKCSSFFQHQC
jgi:hypothetical protein